MRVREKVFNALYGSALYDLMLKGRVPPDVRGAPPDPWLGDAEEGRGILRGEFMLFGKPVRLGDLPWDSPALTSAQAAELHAFGWLRHLAAVASPDAARRAQELLDSWIGRFGRWNETAWRADTLGSRLTNWFLAFPFATSGAETPFKDAVLASAGMQARHLFRAGGSVADDIRRIKVIDGLIASGACLEGHERNLVLGLDLIDRTLARQVLPDGGHIQRNPAVHLEVLGRLVGIRETLTAAQVEAPAGLQQAIDRMVPWLKGTRHGDGRLAVFNGGTEEHELRIEHALLMSGAHGRALNSAPHSGFQRMHAGRTWVIVDTGAGTLAGSNEGAHAGLLSFEMSVGRHRMVVNCGAHPDPTNPWHDALRATAAHSTLTVDDTNAIEVFNTGDARRSAPNVTCRRNEEAGSVFIQLSHDGYMKTFGLLHNRDLYLSARGDDLRGKDLLVGPGGKAFALRFHLHPDVQASLVQDGTAVLLRLESGAGWRFRASGGTIGLEESVYLGQRGAIRRAEQIVVSGGLDGNGATVKWSIGRELRKK
ncbi:MAG: hypothetical protein EXQ86_08590 [Rhodospirillales bacterium]|nr:hypothetical protein [Rhodospirillales bacterium]